MSATIVWPGHTLTFEQGRPVTTDPALLLMARAAVAAAEPSGLRCYDPDLFAAQALIDALGVGEIVAHTAPTMPEGFPDGTRDGPSAPPVDAKSYPGPGHLGLEGHWGGSAPRAGVGWHQPKMYGGSGATYATFEVDDRLLLQTSGLPELEVSYRGSGPRAAGGVSQAVVYDPKSGGQFTVPEANLRRIAPPVPTTTGPDET